jgi:hypothetical protein
MLLTYTGISLPIIGVMGLIIGSEKKSKKIIILSILIPVVYWIGFYCLLEADRRFIEEETEKNGGNPPEWVW